MQIQDIMHKPVVTCRQDDTLHTAAKLMWENDCGAIPVINNDGKLVGMVTDRDICMATFTKARAPQEIPISDAMARNIYTCRADSSLEDVESLMSTKQIRRVPIVNHENRPVGIVSVGDIVRSARQQDGTEREAIHTIAAISQPSGQKH